MSEKDKIKFIIENMEKGLSFCRTATNFSDKRNRDISKDSLGTMLEYLKNLSIIINDSVVVKTDLFKYFWKYLQDEIRDKQKAIEYCHKEDDLKDSIFKERTQGELNRLLLLANICEIDINDTEGLSIENLPDKLECSYCGFRTSDISELRIHFNLHKEELGKID